MDLSGTLFSSTCLLQACLKALMLGVLGVLGVGVACYQYHQGSVACKCLQPRIFIPLLDCVEMCEPRNALELNGRKT